MTVPSSRHTAGSVLRCVMVLVAVLASSLCAVGQSAAESVPASATATADVRHAAGLPLVSGATAERGSVDVGDAAALHEATAPASPDAGHCGKQTALDIASAHDASRPSAPLPTTGSEERRTPAAPTGPGPAFAGPGSAPPAPDLARLSVLRI
ncbi:hypothetical protein J5J01_19415 [Streptomyces fradiae]|uniref:hypothetical protein n=1 Tax=Streptomyces fradiae TaxID=1906 RepID=UPI0020184B47|nr:hypothetical protein [Streptomyces fradiae]UQS29152.1 hypothetical protein J5J01_19415 [Streptomyces fradiae]